METLYDKASLILNPGIYDTGKVYCTKPLDGSGDLTFTRASNATRVNADGLIEKVRTNLLLQSNQFDTTWAPLGANLTSGQTGYDGTTNAWLLTKTSASGRINQSLSTLSSASNTLSVYVKANASTWCAIEYSTSYRYLNLSTGAVSAGSGGYSVQSVGNGWYRLSINSSSSSGTFRIYPAEADDISASSGSIFIQNAQAEVSDFGPTDYIPTTTAAVSVGPVSGLPRLDYSGGASCPSLLLEPQTTALNEYSESFDNAYWTKSGATITANNAVSPDGYTNADKLVEDSSTAFHRLNRNTIAVSTATKYTISIYAKSGERTKFGIQDGQSSQDYATFDLENGTLIDASLNGSITLLSNGWYRCSVEILTISAYVQCAFYILDDSYTSGAPNAATYTGNGTSGLYVWGANLTQTSYLQSYIPTLGSAVTRGADYTYKTGISSIIGQTEGTVFLDLVYNGSESQSGNIFSFDQSILGSIAIIRNTSGTIGAAVWAGSAYATFNGGSMPIGQRTKIAYAYKSGSTALFVNGVQIGTDSTSTFTLPLMSQMYLNSITAYFAFQQDASFDQALLFKTRLTNAQLAELTTL